VLCEAWALSRPALVNAHCAVLDGQARRSGGAIPYAGYAQFEAALQELLQDADLGVELGAAGRRYVEGRYRWDIVMRKYEEFLGHVASGRFAPVAPLLAR